MLITEVISRAFAGLGIQDRAFDPAIHWMQAILTAQADGTYNGHTRMRRDPQRVEFTAGYYRENTLLAHLRSAFWDHFLPESGASADQKEESKERSAGGDVDVVDLFSSKIVLG